MDKKIVNQALKELKEQLINKFGGKVELYLYGSIARGDYNDDSDVDVLILLDRKVDTKIEEEIVGIALDVELEYEIVFGLIIHSFEFWDSGLARVMPLHENIDKEGILV